MFGLLEGEMRKNAENFTTTISKAYRPRRRSGAESKISSRPLGERQCRAKGYSCRDFLLMEALNEWNLHNIGVKPRDQSEMPLGLTTKLMCFYAR